MPGACGMRNRTNVEKNVETRTKLSESAAPRPIREGLFIGRLEQLQDISLAGTKCDTCAETSLGSVTLCPNCGSDRVAALRLNNRGIVWTYTVARHRPPGNYRGPEPFVPFGIGLVELPEGLRVVSTLDCAIDSIKVGLPVTFTPYILQDKEGGAVVAFTYRPAAEAAS
jgi:uncharacterized OB-fold protein